MADPRLGRVVRTHPEDHSLDLVMVDDGSRLAGVQVLSPSASTNTGVADLTEPDISSTGNPWDLTASKGRDVLAVVQFIGRVPIVMGFIFPQICQMTFPDTNRRVNRHASDWYTTVDDAGNFEAYHPSGTYFRIGSSPAHEDLTGKDFDGRWKIDQNTQSAVHVHLGVANAGAPVASVDIDPSGNVSVQNNGTATVTSGGAATVTAPSVTVDSPSSTFTGAVTVQGLLTYQDGIAGSGGSNGSAISGSLAITGGDVTADTVGLKSHTHSDPQGGTVGPASG